MNNKMSEKDIEKEEVNIEIINHEDENENSNDNNNIKLEENLDEKLKNMELSRKLWNSLKILIYVIFALKTK